MSVLTAEILENAFNRIKQNSGKSQNTIIVSPLDLFYLKEYERDETYLKKFPIKVRDQKRLKMRLFYRIADKKKRLDLPF